MARLVSAWWPGGLMAQKALSASPWNTASTAAVAAPTARSAASSEPGRHYRVGIEILEALGGRHGAHALQVLIGVGAQDVLFAAQRRLAARSSRKCSLARIWFTALMRSMRSGWPSGVTWRSDAGWREEQCGHARRSSRFAPGLL